MKATALLAACVLAMLVVSADAAEPAAKPGDQTIVLRRDRTRTGPWWTISERRTDAGVVYDCESICRTGGYVAAFVVGTQVFNHGATSKTECLARLDAKCDVPTALGILDAGTK